MLGESGVIEITKNRHLIRHIHRTIMMRTAPQLILFLVTVNTELSFNEYGFFQVNLFR